MPICREPDIAAHAPAFAICPRKRRRLPPCRPRFPMIIFIFHFHFVIDFCCSSMMFCRAAASPSPVHYFCARRPHGRGAAPSAHALFHEQNRTESQTNTRHDDDIANHSSAAMQQQRISPPHLPAARRLDPFSFAAALRFSDEQITT